MVPSSCSYSYDPLDRLASTSPMGEAPIARFYQKSRLATEVQGALQRTVFQHDDQLLAQQQRLDGNSETSLLVTDQQRSVLKLTDTVESESLAYTAYGHLPPDSGLSALLGFSGERRDQVTGHYLLGNGYRAFNPVLMRFNSPDSLSPFGESGLNAYAYCQGDPVNYRDPTGHIKASLFMNRPRRTSASYKPYFRSPHSVLASRSSVSDRTLDQRIGGNSARRQSGAVATPLSTVASDIPMSVSSFSRPSVAAPSAKFSDSMGNRHEASDPKVRHRMISRVEDSLVRSYKSSEVPDDYGLAIRRRDHHKKIGEYSSDLARYYKSMVDAGVRYVSYSHESRYLKYRKIEITSREKLDEYTANMREKFPVQTNSDVRFTGAV